MVGLDKNYLLLPYVQACELVLFKVGMVFMKHALGFFLWFLMKLEESLGSCPISTLKWFKPQTVPCVVTESQFGSLNLMG